MRSAHSHILGFTKFDRYLSFQILKAVVAVTLGFTALVSMFAFLEELSDAAYGYQLIEIAIFVLSSTPRRLGEVLIFSTFMGCLIALGELAENGEIQAVRLIGASPWRLYVGILPVITTLVLASFFLSEFATPRSDAFAQKYKMLKQSKEDSSMMERDIWIKDQERFIRIGAAGFEESGDPFFEDIYEYSLNPSNDSFRAIQASSAKFADNLWTLYSVELTSKSGDLVSTESHEVYQWELQRTPEQLINRAIQQPKRRSISDLNQEISHQSESEDHQTYKIVIQNRILSPAMYAAMALLALSLSLGAVRKTGMGPRLAVGLFIGLSFKYLQDFLIPMTLVFNLPPLIVAIVPVFICASVAFFLINRYA